MVIGLPPILNFGKGAVREKVLTEVLSGKKVRSHFIYLSWDEHVLSRHIQYISLAITEAFAGSDVAGLRTTAEKTPDGKHFIVTGTKKSVSLPVLHMRSCSDSANSGGSPTELSPTTSPWRAKRRRVDLSIKFGLILTLSCHPNIERNHGPPRRARRRRRDQAHQDVLLLHRRNGLHHLRQSQGPR